MGSPKEQLVCLDTKDLNVAMSMAKNNMALDPTGSSTPSCTSSSSSCQVAPGAPKRVSKTVRINEEANTLSCPAPHEAERLMTERFGCRPGEIHYAETSWSNGKKVVGRPEVVASFNLLHMNEMEMKVIEAPNRMSAGSSSGYDPSAYGSRSFASASGARPDPSGDPAWSQGSELHNTGQCTPCYWFWHQAPKGHGCKAGRACTYCHHCPPNEARRRRRIRKKEGALEKKPEPPDTGQPAAAWRKARELAAEVSRWQPSPSDVPAWTPSAWKPSPQHASCLQQSRKSNEPIIMSL